MIFDRATVRWVAHNYIELSCGVWPDPESDENLVRRKQLSQHAAFENPCLIAGEFAVRVKVCGTDGMLVEDCYGMINGITKRPSQIARERHMKFDDVVNRINKVLWYCTDDEDSRGRRHEDYQTWKNRTRNNRKYAVAERR